MTLATIQDIQTSSLVVQTTTKPENTKGRHPAVVRYRFFSDSRLNTKTFAPTQEGRDAMGAFLREMGARAELVDDRWVLTDKGQVDYMVVGFVDAELNAKREAQRLLAKQMIAAWRANK